MSGNRYRRSVAHNALYQGLADRSPSEHAAFLVEFAEKYPDYPGKRAVCPCVACFVAR
ncbi:hypothetical protein [Microbacterium sp. Leaf320]|uniref:hypothetical protein n=1 Tax=Microbacterium sp. Leaf320 TaxID=1736334 RepID=UPI0012FCC710|nr:hypothetical protein [Microbacterium sp. Leaf320]